MEKYIAAYDVGTSGMKLVLIHPKQGVAGVVRGEYPLCVPFSGYAEQDPEMYWNIACKVTREALKNGTVQAGEVAGVIFACQWKGIIPVDGCMRPLHRAILWLDRRADRQAEALNRALGESNFRGSDYWAKLLWLKEERPEIYERTEKILEINAWMKFRACGSLTSDVTSHFTKSPSVQEQLRYDRILQACNISEQMFPPLVTSDTKVGVLSEEAAKEMGLLTGTPVFGGCGDIPAIARGVGCIGEGDAHIYLGSSGWFGVTSAYNLWPGCRSSGFDLFFKIFFQGLEAVGLAVKWSLENLFQEEYRRLGNGIFEWLNQKLADVEAGSDGLLAVPSFFGENQPFSSKMRAAFLCMNNTHTRFHMHRAIMEGICYLYRFYKESYEKELGQSLAVVKAAGGGACNSLWMQMMADCLGCGVEVCLNPQYAGSIGAARCAMMGLGMEWTETEGATKLYKPNTVVQESYNRNYIIFLRALAMAEEIGNMGTKQVVV